MVWETWEFGSPQLCQLHKMNRMHVHLEVIILIPEWKCSNPHASAVFLGKLENVKHFMVEYFIVTYINDIHR